jgi:hypothetical protein
MQPHVDIAFDCLPLRAVGRVDVPIDASPPFRVRYERLKLAIETHGVENAYFLYNAHCVYRTANSDVDGMLRFAFEGTVFTDRSDAKAERAELAIELVGETCGGVPAEIVAWFQAVIERAVVIEFDRFIAAGRLAERVGQLGHVERISDVADFTAMHL